MKRPKIINGQPDPPFINGKKVGATIRNWQLHTLTYPIDRAKKLYPITTDAVYKFTGTVVEDYIGRWRPADHMKSSLVLSINREVGIIETYNTIYLVGEEGNDIFPDLEDDVEAIFY